MSSIALQLQTSLPIELAEAFISAFGNYFGGKRLGAPPSSALIRYEIRLIAHLIWKISRRSIQRQAARQELFELLRKMDPMTKALLLDGIRELQLGDVPPEHFLYSGRDLSVIYQAALIADQTCRGKGDHLDDALHRTSALLVYLYEIFTDRVATLSRTEVGAAPPSGNMRTVAGSEVARFVLAFFRYADPLLTPARITTALDRRLRELRKRKNAGWADPHDLANLFI